MPVKELEFEKELKKIDLSPIKNSAINFLVEFFRNLFKIFGEIVREMLKRFKGG